jgi:septal ring factor EnvC (AmiA/AmiB activator)
MPNKTLIIISITACIMLLFAGCFSNGPTRSGWQTDPSSGDGSASNNPTAVESAIDLSDKYAKLSEEAVALRQTKQNLTAENQKLKDDFQAAQLELEKSQKELKQAGELLTQMRLELNNWKENVLGFRDEMRDAQKAELEALLKILKLMGAEPKSEPALPAPEGQK